MTILLSFCLLSANAQTSIKAKITDAEDHTILIAADISFYQNGVLTRKTQTDHNGNYNINIDPGNYEVLISYLGYANYYISNVLINANQITKFDSSMSTIEGACWGGFVYDYKIPLIQYDQTTQGAIYLNAWTKTKCVTITPWVRTFSLF